MSEHTAFMGVGVSVCLFVCSGVLYLAWLVGVSLTEDVSCVWHLLLWWTGSETKPPTNNSIVSGTLVGTRECLWPAQKPRLQATLSLFRSLSPFSCAKNETKHEIPPSHVKSTRCLSGLPFVADNAAASGTGAVIGLGAR